jgi:chromate reductase, NAD(P)H dehydrogenase (quinone)
MTTHKVGYLIGSLAKGSINRRLAKALVRLAPPELEMSEISFKDLPLYSYDYDADYPPAGNAFKDAIAAVNAVLFVTPEYNRSIPGGLKNAIDWASRPYGANSFARKPSAVIGTSPGAIGTAVAQQNLRSVLGFCDSPQMNTPEAYIRFTPGLITDDGEVTNDGTGDFLRNFMQEFHMFIARVRSVLPERRVVHASRVMSQCHHAIGGDQTATSNLSIADKRPARRARSAAEEARPQAAASG